jgi:hypothetical protein
MCMQVELSVRRWTQGEDTKDFRALFGNTALLQMLKKHSRHHPQRVQAVAGVPR